MAKIARNEAYQAGLFSEALLYGVYLVTCGFVMRAVGFPRRWQLSRWIIVGAGAALTVNSTFYLCLSFTRIMKITMGQSTNIESAWFSVAKTASYATQPVIGDGILIYRCYLVYAKNWKIVIPSILFWMGMVITFPITTEMQAGDPNMLASQKFRIITAVFNACTLAQNLLTCSLLIWRIWAVERENRQYQMTNGTGTTGKPQSSLTRVILIITESGAIMAATSLVAAVCIETESNTIYIAMGIQMMTIAIAFNLIIIRTCSQRSLGGTAMTRHTQPMAFNVPVSTITGARTQGTDIMSSDSEALESQRVATLDNSNSSIEKQKEEV